MFFCDSHTHSRISPDSEAPLSAMTRAALSAGLDEMCVTDHCDLLDGTGAPVSSFDWAAAKAQFHTSKAKAEGRLTLRLGLELGSAVYDPATARRVLAEGGDELDFVLGSLHNWIGLENNIDLYYSDYGKNPALCHLAMKSCLDHTWTLVTEYADCYDSLAHIIYPLRYIQRDGLQLSLSDYEEQIRAIFTEVARTDHALEVNTCRGRTVSDWVPLLRWFRECGGKLVTVGSDAHRPQDMAKGLPAALALLQAAGFRDVVTYEKRRPILHRL